jgi:WD40 repeat protein
VFLQFPRCSFSPNGNLLAVACAEGVEVWRLSDSTLVCLNQEGDPREAQVTCVAWSPDSKRIVVAARKGAWPFVIDAESGRVVLELEMPGDVDDAVRRFGMSYVSYSPDGRFIAAGRQGEDQFVTLPRENGPVFRYDIVWDARSGAIVGKIKGDYGIRPLFSPHSKSIVTMAPKPAVWRLRE